MFQCFDCVNCCSDLQIIFPSPLTSYNALSCTGFLHQLPFGAVTISHAQSIIGNGNNLLSRHCNRFEKIVQKKTSPIHSLPAQKATAEYCCSTTGTQLLVGDIYFTSVTVQNKGLE